MAIAVGAGVFARRLAAEVAGVWLDRAGWLLARRISDPSGPRRRRGLPHARHRQESTRAYEHIRARLLDDPDGYISYLRGR